MNDVTPDLPIGVFDSGVGGLTVLNALRERMPNEHLLYLGDTARVPYGTKSSESVTRYAEQAAAALIDRRIKLLVIACNTASAVAVEPLQRLYPTMPVMGVVEPGAEASCLASKNKHIGVIATESTVNNLAYQNAITRLSPEAEVTALPCSLFVALAEEGWHHGELVDVIVAKCLKPLKQDDIKIDTLVLGCTHFPVLRQSIADVMGESITLVDSAETTAVAIENNLRANNMHNTMSAMGDDEFLVTDDPARFIRVASNFYRLPIAEEAVKQIDIQHFRLP